MTIDMTGLGRITLRTPQNADSSGDPAVALDRYLVEGQDSGGAIAVVEHVLAAHVLAAPIHRHSREDEYSFVIDGRLGVWQEGEEVIAEPGALVCKPRGRWHTFWNAGDEPLRVLELITPAGIEELFRQLAEPGGEYDPETLPGLARQFGAEVDFATTMPLVQRHALLL
jgi:quercetin dioxygenase-like cupin family protein